MVKAGRISCLNHLGISDIYEMDTVTFTRSQTKKCPFCSEFIQGTAIKCRYCGEFLNTAEAKAAEVGLVPNSQPTEDENEPDNVLFRARPSLWAMSRAVIKGLLFMGVAGCLVVFALEDLANEVLKLELSGNQAIAFGKYRVVAGLVLAAVVLLILLLKAFKLKMTYYEVTSDRIEWGRGILDRRVDNLDMFRVIDLKLRRSLLDCVLGIGTVGLITTDKTDPEFVFEKIRKARQLYDIIKKVSLEADRRSSVVHLE